MLSVVLALAVVTGIAGAWLVAKSLPLRAWLARARLRGRPQRILQERLARRPEVPLIAETGEARPKERANLLPRLTAVLSQTRVQPLLVQLEQALTLARIPLKPAEFLYVSVSSLFLALMIVHLTTNNVVFTLFVTFVAGTSPFHYLRLTQRQRFQKIDYQVSDALLLMTNSLRSGTSFMDAMDVVAREMPPPISEEFARTLRDVTLGIPIEEAFGRMSTRCRSEDIDLAVTAFRINREIGGNLAEILDNIAATIRDRVKLKQEVRTLCAQGKLSGAILCAMPLLLIGVLQVMNPTYLRLLVGSAEGKQMLMVGGALQVLGVLAIARVIKIEV